MLGTASVDLFSSVSGAQNGAARQWPGGEGIFAVAGTLDGATVSLEFLGPNGSTWIAAGAATTLTTNSAGVFRLPAGLIRAVITGGTAPANIFARADRLPV